MHAADYDQLSPDGVKQSQELGAAWAAAEVRFDVVVHGPAKRHIDTAFHVGEALRDKGAPWPEPTEDPDLDEHDGFGLVKAAVPALAGDPAVQDAAARLQQSQTPRERSAGFQRVFELVVKRWLAGLELSGIETWPAFRTRVVRGLEKLRAQCAGGKRVVAFSSVGPVAVALQHALDLSDVKAFETAWRLRNSGVTRFLSSGDRFSLDSYNDVGHLSSAALHTYR